MSCIFNREGIVSFSQKMPARTREAFQNRENRRKVARVENESHGVTLDVPSKDADLSNPRKRLR